MADNPFGPLTRPEAIDAALLAEGLLDECGAPVRPVDRRRNHEDTGGGDV